MNQEHENSMIALLIFYNDKTSLSSDKKINEHLIYLSTTNIACENRYFSKRHFLLTILPNFNV